MFAQDDLIMVLIDQAVPFRGPILDQGPFATDPSLASLFVFFSVFGSQGALTTFAFRLGGVSLWRDAQGDTLLECFRAVKNFF
ncbi:hypothetical protein [Adlercreutzia agrestimuris]|uniref:hypothetical protein n=1 Tax=Adlercreutzia agrestimuris TaxID=2941324 RepID=UPI002040E0C7|nr:hypothetical protein [Adlercreutzia agrestimuris]